MSERGLVITRNYNAATPKLNFIQLLNSKSSSGMMTAIYLRSKFY
ncbi:hypothetical protein LDG_8473 [Legionella drancourtii LLAP12]|uniref:Uncharacterized protein n=1 Tax=Legionella drancourtii LLAP12 TaxID=658187 RepID=G9ET44_9GAMM|nr:hypothetical protein LDG_8473 [Legionella drancourtii LLAP12]